MIFDNKNLGFGLFYEFLDHFQFHGGFDQLRKVLQRVVPFEDNPVLPLDLIPEFTSPFKACSNILNPEYTKEMAEELQSIIVGRLKNMSDDSMKEMDKNTIHSIMSDFRDFLCLGLPEEVVDEQLESVKLGLALRFLKSPEMKKRLTGINEIKSIVRSTERIGSGIVHHKWQDDDTPEIRSRWLKPEYLINWIEENKLVEFLLGESSHVEVIKRSASLLIFLANNNHLNVNHLELLWKSQEDKHEATVLGVYETINEIASYLNKDSILYLFEKINSMPIKKYNEQTVKFVKEFTLKSFEVFRSIRGSELVDISSDNDDEESKVNEFIVDNAKGIIEGNVAIPDSDMPEFGLPILFEILQQNSELGGHTLSEFIDLLKESTSDACKASYVLKCIKNMMEGTAVYQSISIFMSIFNLAFNYRSFEIELNSEVAIKKLNDQFDFIGLTIQNIERYNSLVQKQMVDSVNKGLVPENVSKTKFEGNVTHAEQLDKLLEFIENVISTSDNRVEIGTANIQKLWNIFVSASSIEFDKNTFFKWLCKESSIYTTSMMVSSSQSLLNDEEKTFLFEQILCKNEYVQKKEISLSCFKCFKKYFGLDNKYIAFSRR